MVVTEPIAKGIVSALCVNGEGVERLSFEVSGPVGDKHAGFTRILSGHDGEYIRTSSLSKDERVLNWRTWTGISEEEILEIEHELGVGIPQGCLLENVIFCGIPNFSSLMPTTRLVFPLKEHQETGKQAILAVWEENVPCKHVGQRLANHHGDFGLMAKFVTAAHGKRGVLGMVLATGLIEVGDEVLVYPPALAPPRPDRLPRIESAGVRGAAALASKQLSRISSR